MSNDIGNKRPIDDIQDDETAADLRKVPSQDADNENGVTYAHNSDAGVTAETETTATTATTATTTTTTTTTNQNASSTNNTQGSSASKVQERQRGQRMFGMLMGTLNKFDRAQKQNEDQARKRQAIDTKQQERLLEEKKAIQASLLQSQQDRVKRNQQRQVDLDENKFKQDAVHQKNLAHYLITTTSTSRLTYLPKKLLPEQQDQIDRQIRDANAAAMTVDSGQGNDQDQQDQKQ